MDECRVKLLQKVYKKYIIIRFRQKISFIAFKKKMSLVELFLLAIQKSFDELLKDGRVYYSENDRKNDDELYNTCVSEDNTSMKGLLQGL